MPTYRLFVMHNGHPALRIVRDCDDDVDALAFACQFCNGRAVEVWEGDRLVARLDQHDEPAPTATPGSFDDRA